MPYVVLATIRRELTLSANTSSNTQGKVVRINSNRVDRRTSTLRRAA